MCCAQEAGSLQSNSAKQPLPDASPKKAEPIVDEGFKSLLNEQKENRLKISRLYASMPIGVVSAQIEHRKKINALVKRNQEINVRLEPAAIAELQSSDEPEPGVVNFLLQRMQWKLDGKNPQVPFNPPSALELLEALKGAHGKVPDLTSYIYYANLLSNRIGQARSVLENATKQGFGIPASTLSQLEAYEQKWQPELVRRTAEKTADDLPRVFIETEKGNITVELFENEAPNTVKNFIALVEAGFYDGLIFHQVDPTSACQSGCPKGDGTGNANHRIACECKQLNSRPHFTGSLSMALSGLDTGSSQFRIAKQPLPALDGQATVFGRVIEGMPVVYQMQSRQSGNAQARGIAPSKIVKATVIRKRNHPYVPEKIKDNGSDASD